MPQNERTLLKLAYVGRVLATYSHANQDLARKYVDQRRAEGVKVSSLMNVAVALRVLDRDHAGRPLPSLTPQDLAASLLRYTASHAPASATSWAAVVRSYYRHLNDGELPPAIGKALKRKHREEWRDVMPITTDERDALLRAAADTPQRGAAARRQALVWTLWDSGFRVSELLALRVGSFEPDEKGGALLRLPKDAPDLKTGPRTIYVVECVGPLKTWLAFHPRAADPKAPLFPSKDDHSRSPWPQNVNGMLEELCGRAGVRKTNPHLFRHTRATRAAIAGWNEAQLRAYFGWSATSTMAARYVHLSQRNMEDRVRQDANLDPLGARIQADPQRAIADVASAAAATSSAAVIKALMDAGVLPKPSAPERDDGEEGAATPMTRG